MKKMVAEGGDPKFEADRFKDVPTFAEFAAEHYMPHAKTRKRSWISDDSLLRNHILPVLGKHRLSRIRRSDIVGLHNSMKQSGYAAATANRTLVLISFMFNCAMRWEVMPMVPNPASAIVPFPDNGARERYLSQEEAHRLMAELETNANHQACNIIKLLLFTGARKTEIMHARWEFVDFERHLLTVPLAKSGKARHDPAVRRSPRCSALPAPRHSNSLAVLESKHRAATGLDTSRLGYDPTAGWHSGCAPA